MSLLITCILERQRMQATPFLTCRAEMSWKVMLTLTNLAHFHRACRQLHSLACRKGHRTQWRPVLSSAYTMCPVQLHPLLWQPSTNSQFRLLSTKEVINGNFILVCEMKISSVCRYIIYWWFSLKWQSKQRGRCMQKLDVFSANSFVSCQVKVFSPFWYDKAIGETVEINKKG